MSREGGVVKCVGAQAGVHVGSGGTEQLKVGRCPVIKGAEENKGV